MSYQASLKDARIQWFSWEEIIVSLSNCDLIFVEDIKLTIHSDFFSFAILWKDPLDENSSNPERSLWPLP